MKTTSRWIPLAVAISLACIPFAGANADNDYHHNNGYSHNKDYHDRDRHPYAIHRGHNYRVPPERVRHYRNVVIVRPYGHQYYGYGHYHADNDAFAWLAFTAITLKVLDNLNEEQQRAHEAAQIHATSAPIGERIIWNQGNASGAVTPLRDGYSTAGRYCREFQQEVAIGGHAEQAYGTACQQPDGSWEIISTGDQP